MISNTKDLQTEGYKRKIIYGSIF